MSILDRINKPNDIKAVSPRELPALADEIRQFLIANVSRTGGHLASNLGVVELTMALHRVMNFPGDKLIFDVGHQSYTHKLLTGRKDDFYKLRHYGGMSGFPKRSESDCDAFNTGHSSTSISAAIGMAEARDLRGSSERICAVIGDGSMTGGMVYEALNQLSQLGSGCLIILNDNEMSISHNVGGMSSSLSRFRIGKPYNDLKNSVEKTLLNIPEVGYKMARGVKRSKDSIKSLIVPGNIFSEMGITYVGPIDGHDVNVMTEIFEDAFDLNKPVIVHVKTVKGKGYKLAERYPEYFHGVGPFNPETGRALKDKSCDTYTDVFSRALVSVGEKDERVVAITAAMARGTGVRAFQRRFPKRCFDVGIAEQHAVTFAAGMAVDGYIPVVAVYSSFMQRAYDQLLHDVCLQRLHVVICLDRSGIVGEDGDTHMGIYDTAYLRSLPGMTVLTPRDGQELADMLEYAVHSVDGPVAIKYGKGRAYTGLSSKGQKLVMGKAEVINFEKTLGQGLKKSLAIIAVGSMVETAVSVRDRFEAEAGYIPELINLRFIKPLDRDRIAETLRRFDCVAVIEESVRRGSVGEEIAYIMVSEGVTTSFRHFCIKEETVPHGSVAQLREREGLDVDSIYRELYETLCK